MTTDSSPETLRPAIISLSDLLVLCGMLGVMSSLVIPVMAKLRPALVYSAPTVSQVALIETEAGSASGVVEVAARPAALK